MKKTGETLNEISKLFSVENVDFVMTRFNLESKVDPNDLDILVKPSNFSKAIKLLEGHGYKSFSHDQALGGRIRGAQVNLVKPGRIKIDLHRDFTWRRTRYFDLALVWDNLQKGRIDGVTVMIPKSDIDAFIVLVNIIFEKTYITKEDWRYMKKILKKSIFKDQAKKYGWDGTYRRNTRWWKDKGKNAHDFPLFLPTSLVLYSYSEKFDLVSLLYYCFFRTRYLINKRLPYD